MARSAYPTKTTAVATTVELARIAKISASELDETQDATPGLEPDLLTLVKRLVHQMDLLEVSDFSGWQGAVDALTRDDFKKLFTLAKADRLRIRYAMYGSQRSILLLLQTDLTAVL